VATSVATAAKSVAKAEKMANKELLRAAEASKRVERQAAAKVAAAAKSVAKAEKKAEIDSMLAADTSRKAVKRAAVEIATATESVAQAEKEVVELGKRARAAESAAAASAARATHKLPEAFRARVEAAEADVVAAEVAGEALQEEVDELSAEVRALRQKLDAKSLVECRIPLTNFDYMWLKIGAYLNLSATGVCSRVPLPIFVQPNNSYSGTY
jgi:colicin import membrane protein